MNEAKEQQPSDETRVNVKSQVAQMLIDAMERGDTPWQRPWDAQQGSPMSAMNPTTGNAYKGVNRILLAIAGAGFGSNHWMTYQQAAAKGWNVRKGEKGTMIVKVVEFDREDRAGQAGLGGRDAGSQGAGGGWSGNRSGKRGGNIEGQSGHGNGGSKEQGDQDRKAFALRRYFVFNAEQIEGMPQPEAEAGNTESVSVAEKAEAVIAAMKERTGLLVIHGGDKAFYSPKLDEVRIPAKRSFRSEYDYFSTIFHEFSHSTLHEKRLNRTNAIGQKWGDSAYALEELRAEIASAILSDSTGLSARCSPESMKAHVENHSAYLKSWIKAIEKDPMAVFSAAKDAEAMAEYVLEQERLFTALAPHKEWVAEYERVASQK
jgi:antirestriction protein ArdC